MRVHGWKRVENFLKNEVRSLLYVVKNKTGLKYLIFLKYTPRHMLVHFCEKMNVFSVLRKNEKKYYISER